DLSRTIDAVRFDDDVDICVLASKLDGIWSAGADINLLASSTPDYKAMFCLDCQEILNKMESTPKLFIAAIDGHCVGGGLEIAMATDLRLASDGAWRVGLPEVTLGVLPGTGGTQRLPRLVGKSRAIDLMATGRMITPKDALDWGLFNRVFPRAKFWDETMAFAIGLAYPQHSGRAGGLITTSATEDTLNRPEKLNAMSMVLKEELIRALRELDADKATRVIVITGAGQKAFTAGADIHEFHGRTPMEQWRMYEHGTLYDAVDRMSKPILAMINGYCFGGGLELAMACDIRIASSRATLGQTELNIGIIPGGGGSQRLSRLVGLGNAMKLTLTGDRIDAAEALRIGLVDEVVPNARLEPRTFEIAGKIAAHSALAVRFAKAAIRASTRLPLDQGLRYEQTLFALAMASADKEEGVQAFLEKREALWKDR